MNFSIKQPFATLFIILLFGSIILNLFILFDRNAESNMPTDSGITPTATSQLYPTEAMDEQEKAAPSISSTLMGGTYTSYVNGIPTYFKITIPEDFSDREVGVYDSIQPEANSETYDLSTSMLFWAAQSYDSLDFPFMDLRINLNAERSDIELGENSVIVDEFVYENSNAIEGEQDINFVISNETGTEDYYLKAYLDCLSDDDNSDLFFVISSYYIGDKTDLIVEYVQSLIKNDIEYSCSA